MFKMFQFEKRRYFVLKTAVSHLKLLIIVELYNVVLKTVDIKCKRVLQNQHNCLRYERLHSL